MIRHHSPPPAIAHCPLVCCTLCPQSRARSPSVLPPSRFLVPVCAVCLHLHGFAQAHTISRLCTCRLTTAYALAPRAATVSSWAVCTVSRVRFSLVRPRSCPSASPFACARCLRAVPLVRLSLSHRPCRFTPSALPRVMPPVLSHLAPAQYAPSLDPRHALSRTVARPRRDLVPRGILLGPLATLSCRATLPRCARVPHHVVWTPAVPRTALSQPLAPRCAMWHLVARPCRTLAPHHTLWTRAHHVGTRVLYHCAARRSHGVSCTPARHPTHPVASLPISTRCFVPRGPYQRHGRHTLSLPHPLSPPACLVVAPRALATAQVACPLVAPTAISPPVRCVAALPHPALCTPHPALCTLRHMRSAALCRLHTPPRRLAPSLVPVRLCCARTCRVAIPHSLSSHPRRVVRFLHRLASPVRLHTIRAAVPLVRMLIPAPLPPILANLWSGPASGRY
ncbi:hypothetical protein DENSPDRAFT_886362 [Dentipellis sp. KUC8613]|nr:hypothetical protein DENSPDRAFT_886362 [Dentipellis sp. KUC8613]